MNPKANGTGLKWFLTAAVCLALFTGFGNMPLYGRYYIADLPGFHWSGNFIVNLKLHLIVGAIFLALVIYRFMGILIQGQNLAAFTILEKLTGLALALVVLSGLLAGIKNFAFLTPALALNMTLTFFHLGSAILLMIVGLAFLLVRPKKIQS